MKKITEIEGITKEVVKGLAREGRSVFFVFGQLGDPIGLSIYIFMEGMVDDRYKVRKPNS